MYSSNPHLLIFLLSRPHLDLHSFPTRRSSDLRYIGLSPSVEGGYNSYFYINDRKSSLSEFDSLLAHARISAEGYNLVQQGDIQRIVSMSSVERRRILDNIAGITKFDADIKQAEGKRKETEENLERIRIILDEIDKQIKQR